MRALEAAMMGRQIGDQAKEPDLSGSLLHKKAPDNAGAL
jgi:hypothetical protein